jgi:hypothetical protein
LEFYGFSTGAKLYTSCSKYTALPDIWIDWQNKQSHKSELSESSLRVLTILHNYVAKGQLFVSHVEWMYSSKLFLYVLACSQQMNKSVWESLAPIRNSIYHLFANHLEAFCGQITEVIPFQGNLSYFRKRLKELSPISKKKLLRAWLTVSQSRGLESAVLDLDKSLGRFFVFEDLFSEDFTEQAHPPFRKFLFGWICFTGFPNTGTGNFDLESWFGFPEDHLWILSIVIVLSSATALKSWELETCIAYFVLAHYDRLDTSPVILMGQPASRIKRANRLSILLEACIYHLLWVAGLCDNPFGSSAGFYPRLNSLGFYNLYFLVKSRLESSDNVGDIIREEILINDPEQIFMFDTLLCQYKSCMESTMVFKTMFSLQTEVPSGGDLLVLLKPSIKRPSDSYNAFGLLNFEEC